MTQTDPRMAALITDYNATREDERSFHTAQATLFSLALAALSVVAFVLRNDCRLTRSAAECRAIPDATLTPDAIVAAMPLIPLALIAYLQIAGSLATLRSYYLRALEREIRSSMDISELTSYRGLKIASMGEFFSSHINLSGRHNVQPLAIVIFGAILIVFGGSTLVAFVFVDVPWKLAMVLVYGVAAYLIIRETKRSTVDGRRYFEQSVQIVGQRSDDPLTPEVGTRPRRRSLLSYLLIPRPDDLIKALFFPALFGFSILSGQVSIDDMAPSTIGRAVVFWAALEMLIYPARYQWNDIVEAEADAQHPEASKRRRLPYTSGDRTSLQIAIRASTLAMLARLYIVIILIFVPALGLSWGLLVWSGLVFGLAVAYEVVRKLRPQTIGVQKVVSWTIYFMVGLGYAVRGLAGVWAAGYDAHAPAGAALSTAEHLFQPMYVLLALFLAAYGSTFVTLTWALDASSYCLAEVKPGWKSQNENATIPWDRALSEKPHLEHLLKSMRVRLSAQGEDGGKSKRTAGAVSRPLISGDRAYTPYGLFIVVAASLAGLVGLVFADGLELGTTWVLIFFALLGVLLCAVSQGWRLFVVAGGTLVALVVSQLYASQWLASIVAALPWLALGITVVAFRRSSYAELKDAPANLALGIVGLLATIVRFSMGGAAAEALGLVRKGR